MGWLTHLEDSRAIKAIFGVDDPTMAPILIYDLSLQKDGGCLTVSFDFSTFPVAVPAKWKAMAANRVKARLRFVDVESIVISGWSASIEEWTCEIEANKKDARKAVTLNPVSGLGLTRFHCGWIYCVDISAYHFE